MRRQQLKSILWFVIGFALIGYVQSGWEEVSRFLRELGVPRGVTGPLGIVVAVAAVYALVKVALVRSIPRRLEFTKTDAGEFPRVDRATLDRLTAELQRLGFTVLTDYSIASASGVARVFAHPEQFCFAEVGQVVLPSGKVTPMTVAINSVLQDGWTLSTGSAKPQGASYMMRRPRNLWSCQPGASAEALYHAHLQRRFRMANDLGIGVSREVSAEAYFDEEQRANAGRREVIRRRNLAVVLVEAVLFELRGSGEWLGDYPKLAAERGADAQSIRDLWQKTRPAATESGVRGRNVAPLWRVLLIPLVVVGAVFALRFVPLPAPRFPLSSARLARAPYDWRVFGLDGKEVSAESFRGKVVVLNFWATWCGPCRDEMPALEELLEALGNDITVACISNESADVLRDYVDETGTRLPIYRMEGKRPAEFEAEGVPVTFIIGKDGMIRFRQSGAVDWAHEEARRFLSELAGEKAEVMSHDS